MKTIQKRGYPDQPSQYITFSEAFEKYIPFHIDERKKDGFVAHFFIPTSLAGFSDEEAARRFELIPGKEEEGKRGIRYTVRIGFMKGKQQIWVEHPEEHTRMRVAVAGIANVVFANNLSDMNEAQLPSNVAPLIFSTVVRVIVEYADRFNPGAITFTAYHGDLVQPYDILCKRAEQKFDYVYATRHLEETYVMLSRFFYDRLEAAVASS